MRRQEAPKLGHVTPSNLLLIHHSCPQGEKTNKSAQTHLPKGGIRIESFTDDANDSNNSALLHSTLLPLYPLFFLSEEFRFLPYFAFRFYLRLSLLNVKSESLEGICRYYVKLGEEKFAGGPGPHSRRFTPKPTRLSLFLLSSSSLPHVSFLPFPSLLLLLLLLLSLSLLSLSLSLFRLFQLSAARPGQGANDGVESHGC